MQSLVICESKYLARYIFSESDVGRTIWCHYFLSIFGTCKLSPHKGVVMHVNNYFIEVTTGH